MSKEEKDFQNRALLTLIRLAKKPGRQDLNDALENLKKKVSQNAGLDQLEKSMELLKGEIVRFELNGDIQPEHSVPEPSPATSHPADPGAVFNEVKETFIEILNEINLDLEDDYLDEIKGLKKSINEAADIESLIKLRGDIERVIRDFAQTIFTERKKAAGFIAEVAQRLQEMEQHLLSSVDHIKKNYKVNTEFNTRMDAELRLTKTSVDKIENFDQLKSFIITKLNTLGKVIKNKHAHDQEMMKTASGNLGGFQKKFGNIQDKVSQVQDENLNLLRKLRLDSLTGAFNRLAYEEQLAQEMSRFLRYKRPFSLIIFDIDKFKNINDNFGHLIGDKCLQETIKKIKPALRQDDLLARYGGDEFIIILPETKKDAACEAAEKIRQIIDDTDFRVRGSSVPLTISLGVTEVVDSDAGSESAFDRADMALYEAKKKGRNQVCAH